MTHFCNRASESARNNVDSTTALDISKSYYDFLRKEKNGALGNSIHLHTWGSLKEQFQENKDEFIKKAELYASTIK